MKSYFKRLYEYNNWANDLFAQVLLSNNIENPKVLELFSHIGNAQILWLNRVSRIQGKMPAVFELHGLNDAIDLVEKSGRLWLDYIVNMDDAGNQIEYHNSQGQSYSSELSDILIHVANHGTHHRGQIATLLRQENVAPPASDFIFFSRA